MLSQKPSHELRTPHALAVARENAATIRAIPSDELPDGPARDALIALAESGADVYAYRPLGSRTFVLWIRPEYAWQDGRMTPAQWVARFHAVGSPVIGGH